MTLRDVAQHVGMSVTTVSNVVRGWPFVADETRRRVQQAIVELGYSPHPIAQSLRTGQMQTLGFIVPDLSNPYFASMVSVAETIAQERHYSLIVFNTHEDDAREAECIRRATNRLVDGMLIAHVIDTRDGGARLRGLSLPVVSIDRVPEGYDGPSCTIDNIRAATLATEHLGALGHERIAHIAGPVGALPARDRLLGYRDTLRARGLGYERVTYCDASWGCAAGYRAMTEILADPVRPTAVFASNDRVAIGALHAIRDAGLSVPGDIALVGLDDIEVSEHVQPPLTTVRQPIQDVARAGIGLLLALVGGERPAELNVVLEPALVVRESSGARVTEKRV